MNTYKNLKNKSQITLLCFTSEEEPFPGKYNTMPGQEIVSKS